MGQGHEASAGRSVVPGAQAGKGQTGTDEQRGGEVACHREELERFGQQVEEERGVQSFQQVVDGPHEGFDDSTDERGRMES